MPAPVDVAAGMTGVPHPRTRALLCAALLAAVLAAVPAVPGAEPAGDYETAAAAVARRDWPTALAQLTSLAEGGDARSQVYLASMYRQGLGVPRNPARAAQWFERAAAQGHAVAQHNLAVLYSRGIGVAADQRRASELFQAAAARGELAAQVNLGLRLFEGIDFVRPDPVRGLAWLHRAALAGNQQAMRRLDHLAPRLGQRRRAEAEALAKNL